MGSLVFYSFGEPFYLFLILASIFVNYLLGLGIAKYQKGRPARFFLFLTALGYNFGLLLFFKYTDFLIENVNLLLKMCGIDWQFSALNLSLPLGISFYTFQIVSYIIDVYRGKVNADKSLISLGAYICMFPQLIAGPIVVYSDIADALKKRSVSIQNIDSGLKTFIVGLGYKVIIANRIGTLWNEVCTIGFESISTPLAWLGAVAYSMQLYFDFWGYSVMAIGLGEMLGFKMPENFRYPYTARSVTEFWHRWHITLGTWFREYVYIPLGGNRKGTARTYINLILVFFLTGIWHGAGWTFILWGFYHGFFNILERCFLGKWMGKGKWKILERGYTLFVVLIGWVIFRAPDFSYALDYIRYMFVPHESVLRIERFFDTKLILYMVIAILGSGMIQSMLKRKKIRIAGDSGISLVGMAGYMAVLWISLMLLVNDTYNPFIYFRF